MPSKQQSGTGRVLSVRELNRATLERQYLLRRHDIPMSEAIERLVGLQAQTTTTWYHGLWCRLEGFRPELLAEEILERRLVRIALMRSTIHLVTIRDCGGIRPLIQPVLQRSMRGNFGRNLNGLELDEIATAGREVVEEKPLTFSELGRRLKERWPDRDPASLAQAVRALEPLVQVPPRGIWGRSGTAEHTSAEAWTGDPLPPSYTLQELVRRYLTAFGPAGVKDMQTWSGLTRLREVFEAMRSELVTFRDEDGVELFDLPEAPRPDPDTPAPVRYLYDYDNLLLSHANRSRVISEGYHAQNFSFTGPMPRVVLVDGFTAGTWTLDAQRGHAMLTVHPFQRQSTDVEERLEAEGSQLLDFAHPKARTREIRFTDPT